MIHATCRSRGLLLVYSVIDSSIYRGFRLLLYTVTYYHVRVEFITAWKIMHSPIITERSLTTVEEQHYLMY